jgi:hypothetical protein
VAGTGRDVQHPQAALGAGRIEQRRGHPSGQLSELAVVLVGDPRVPGRLELDERIDVDLGRHVHPLRSSPSAGTMA